MHGNHATLSTPTVVAQAAPEPIVGPPESSEAAPAMRIADFESLAFSSHPALVRARAQISIASGRWVQAGLPPNPRVGYLGSEIGNEGAAGQQGAYVGQLMVTGRKLQLAQTVVSREVALRQQQYRAAELRVMNDVRTAYYNVLAAGRRKKLSDRLVAIGVEAVSTVELLIRAKEVSRVDLLQAQIEAESARNTQSAAKAEYLGAWRTLASVAAVPELVPQPLEDDLDVLPDARDYHAALARLLDESPQLSAAWTEVSRSRWALARARVEPVPNVDVVGSVQFDDATNYTIAGLQIEIPLPIRNQNPGGIRAAAAGVTSARASARRLELALGQQLADAFAQYETAYQQVERYRSTILPAAQDSLDIVVSGYRQGEFPYLRLLTAQRVFFRTNLDYIEALRRLKTSTIAMDGLLLSASLGPPPQGATDANYPQTVPLRSTYSP